MPEPEDVLTVRVDDLGGTLVVQVTGEIDMMTCALLSDPLFACLDAAPRAVVVDLTEVGFIGAQGLNLLVEVERRARREAIAVRFVANTAVVRRPLELCGLDGSLPFSRCLQHALESVAVAKNAGTG